MTPLLIRACVCGRRGFERSIMNGIPVARCSACSLIHQSVTMSPEELRQYYEEQYLQKVYTHSGLQDREVADKRLDAYKFAPGMQVLDIGAGAGWFVDAARLRGVEAVGCEVSMVAKATAFIYNRDLEECRFPSTSFDIVTMHDALEHLVDPYRTLVEVCRILKDTGRLIVEIPNFFGPPEVSQHHWKAVEHLWFFAREQLKILLMRAGFKVKSVSKPIESKLLFTAEVVSRARTSILVPPGIGDIYWTMVKMRSMCKALGIVGQPDICISSMDPTKDRSVEYVKRIPFVRAAGYLVHKNNRKWRPVWHEAYVQDGRTIFRDVEGCKYFVSYNGILRAGHSLDNVDGASEWMFDIYESLEERRYRKDFVEKKGDYIVAYFVDHGMYKHWMEELDGPAIIGMLNNITRATLSPVVLIGAKWDLDSPLYKSICLQCPRVVDMVGKTSLPECFAILRGAKAVVGFPSGVTIMATAFSVPTAIFWNKYFKKDFWLNACAPESLGGWYWGFDTADSRAPAVVVDMMRNFTRSC